MIEALFCCPSCKREHHLQDVATAEKSCPCGWQGQVTEAISERSLEKCPVCGCQDLYLQKDFPQRVGLTLVIAAVVLSTIAWGYRHPYVALSILIVFGALDWVFFHTRKDMTVCYRCLAQFRNMTPNPSHNAFDLGIGERYRQERLRLEGF